MVGRLPESWIPPEHLLDLRARVRLRHTLVDQRREWQQRIQAVLYTTASRRAAGCSAPVARLAGGPRAAVGGTRADHDRARADRRLDAQLAPLDRELRAYASASPAAGR